MRTTNQERHTLLSYLQQQVAIAEGNSTSVEVEEVRKSFLHSKPLLLILSSGQGYALNIILYLKRYGCATNLELQKDLRASRQTIDQSLKSLERLGVIENYSDRAKPNLKTIPVHYQGAYIWGFPNLPPEHAENAIIRYEKFFTHRGKYEPLVDVVALANSFKSELPVPILGRFDFTMVMLKEFLKKKGVSPKDLKKVIDLLKPIFTEMGLKWA